MIKNKKILSVLSTTAITGLMLAAVSSTAFAKATAIAVNSTDGKIYEYQYDSLKASAAAQIIKGSSDPDAKLYNDFLQKRTSIKAFYDDVKKAYVDFDTISKAAANAAAQGISFSLDSFLGSTTTQTTTVTTISVSVDASGNLVFNDTKAPVGTGIYANLRTIATGKDKVIVYFSEAMDTTTLTNKDNYKFVNGEGATKALPADATITVGGDYKSAIIEFPTIYNVKTGGKKIDSNSNNIYSVIVSNVKNIAGNLLDTLAYSNNGKIDKAYAGTNVVDNSLKVYYDGDDLKLDVTFTRALDAVNINDFTFGGVHPSSATINGSKLTLIFKDGASATVSEIAAHSITYANGKTNSNPTKIDIVKSQGQNAKLAINATTTTDETGSPVSINDDGSSATLSVAQSTVYDYQASPKTASDYWSATKGANGGEIYLTFDTILDPNSGIKTDDFTFTGSNGTDLSADSVTISGNTVIFRFNTTNKNYAAFTSYVDIRAKSSVSLRTVKDVDGNNASYVPSTDDIKKRTITISE